jgi:hypothetical protein
MGQPTPGPIVLPTDVALAVSETLKAWVPYYLARIDEQHDRDPGTTVPPTSWSLATELDRWLEETPPAALVVCPGTVGEPERHGDGASYGAWFRVNIGITAGGATEGGAWDLAGRHGAAVFTTIAQQADMGGLAADTRWGGMNIAETRNRKLMAVEAIALVYVRHIVATRGPLLPRVVPDPPTDQAAETPTPSSARERVTVRRGNVD